MEAAFLRGQKDIQREAEKKAAAQFKKEKDRYEQEMKSLRRDRERFEEQKRLAEKARETAEQAKALADKEKDLADEARKQVEIELQSRDEESIDDLVNRLRKKHKAKTDSSDDDDDEPAAPRSKKIKSGREFDPNGYFKTPSKYEGMNLDGLVLFKQVEEPIRKMIAKEEFFELSKMYTGEEVVTTQFGHVTMTTTKKDVPKDITQKSELFFLLYQFGQYYLQIYPSKASGFLEYLGYLTKICDNFTAPALVRLDSALRKEYINNPEWNWSQTIDVIDKIQQYHARIPGNLKNSAHVNTTGPVQAKPKQKPRVPPPFHMQSVMQKAQPPVQIQRYVNVPQPQVQPGFSGGPQVMQMQQAPMQQFKPPFPAKGNKRKGQQQRPKESKQAKIQRILQQNPNIRNERCFPYNYGDMGCPHFPECLRLHVCWVCGDPAHRGPFCNKHAG